MKHFILTCIISAFVAVFIYACGSSDGDMTNGSGSGQVALYMTDDISDYKEVIATINDVRLSHTGSGSSCDILPDPVTLDIT
ncbi:MAG: hypothetical protein IME96_02210, partial [Proteobacteria bacterium]|nr:hypothetical protein [Pseudomonadota bacterium]